MPVLDDAAAAELTRLGSQIEAHFGAPQDIEWAHADGGFYVVQSRPITALPLPEADLPTDWSVPDPTAMYVRASIVEQLPDPLTPLFADLVDGSVTRSLQALFTELTGEGVVRDTDVDLPTVNGYAYYRYSRAGMARLMLHSGGAFKLLFTPGDHGLQARWRNYAHPRYQAAVDRWSDRSVDQLSPAELVAGVSELLDAGTEYYTSVQTIIPIAATSEVLFTQFYDRLVRRDGDPPAATFLLGFDSLPIRSEKSLYDLAGWARSQPGLAETLLATSTEQLVAILRGEDPLAQEPAWAEWRSRFQAHLDAYGHTIYNLDFANAVPADDPAPLLETLRFYLRGEGSDPYARQQASADRREQQTRGRAGAAGSRPGASVHPAAALGAAGGPDPRGRAGRRRPGLAADAPDARRAGPAPRLSRRARCAGRGVLAVPRGTAGRSGGGRVGCDAARAGGDDRGTPGAVAGSASSHPTADPAGELQVHAVVRQHDAGDHRRAGQ